MIPALVFPTTSEVLDVYPWLMFWAPQLHYPLSGGVAQQIQPSFFDSIDPSSGDGTIERRAFEIASYGRQLGLITEVLIALADKIPPGQKDVQESLARLKEIRARIEQIKVDDAVGLEQDIEQKLVRLKRLHKAGYARTRKKVTLALALEDKRGD